MKSIEILDTTLRDGKQGGGMSFSQEDRAEITKALCALGIPLVEAGNPAANKSDLEFFVNSVGCDFSHALVAFSSTRKKGVSAEKDANLSALNMANTSVVSIFGKAWDTHVKNILSSSLEENLEMISNSVSYLSSRSKRVIFDAEGFFDGYLSNPSYALDCLAAAMLSGADTLVLCDTRGGALPQDVERITRAVKDKFPDLIIGIHAHNDSGLAVANSIAAVLGGATHVQGTFLGIGERCGNANLATVIADLELKLNCSCLPCGNLSMLTATAIKIADVANISIKRNEPYVGSAAFSHKAGMHADAVLKDPTTYEHVAPETVGNSRQLLVSDISGRSLLYAKLKKLYPNITPDSPEANLVMQSLKAREFCDYQFEYAEASFELFVKRVLNDFTPHFELINYRSISEKPPVDNLPATVVMKISVGGKSTVAAADGTGPVHALDLSLRKGLKKFYPDIMKMSLVDFKVRVLDSQSASAASVRVMITSTDGEEIWTTVGVSQDLIEASYLALSDSIEYFLRNI